jgi:hypothetical protein
MAELRDIQARIAALLEGMGGRLLDGAAGAGTAASLTVEIDGRHLAVVIYDATDLRPAETGKAVAAADPVGGVPQQDLVYDVSQFSRTAKPAEGQ